MNSGRNKIKAFFEKEDLRLEEFDEEIFETLVHKAIIGEVKDNGDILQFDSFQNFISFEKQPDGSLQKKLKTKIKVKVTLNN